jgi:hypothetical protein
VIDAPEWLEDYKGYIGFAQRRTLFCDHCNHLVIWLVACNSDGSSTTTNLDGPGGHGLLRTPRAVERFLRDHPQARGVAQAP